MERYDPEAYAALNFQWREFACRCGCGFGLRPGDVDPKLIAGLQLLRTILQAPVRINSACRCINHNRIVGGALGSQHTLGKAADVTCGIPGRRSVERIAEVAMTIPQFQRGGIIQYHTKGFCHLDTRPHHYHSIVV